MRFYNYFFYFLSKFYKIDGFLSDYFVNFVWWAKSNGCVDILGKFGGFFSPVACFKRYWSSAVRESPLFEPVLEGATGWVGFGYSNFMPFAALY